MTMFFHREVAKYAEKSQNLCNLCVPGGKMAPVRVSPNLSPLLSSQQPAVATKVANSGHMVSPVLTMASGCHCTPIQKG